MALKTRSVIRLGSPGRGSQAITLPADFVAENNLRPGDRVYVLLNRKSLLVTTDRKIAESLADRIHEKQAEVIYEGAVEESADDAEPAGQVKESTAGAGERA